MRRLFCLLVGTTSCAAETTAGAPTFDETSRTCRTLGSIATFSGKSPLDGSFGDDGDPIYAFGHMMDGLARSDDPVLLMVPVGFEHIAAARDDDAATLRVIGSGALSDLEWGLCPTFETRATLVVTPSRVGSGSFEVRDDGDEVSSTPLRVAEAVSMDLELSQSGNTIEAVLFDDGGNRLYAPDVFWEIAPVSAGGAVPLGNIALIGSIVGPQTRMRVSATRGALSVTVDLERDNVPNAGAAYWRRASE